MQASPRPSGVPERSDPFADVFLQPRSAVASGLGSRSLAPWSCGINLGLTTLRREPLLGLKRLVLPVSYWRFQEFAYVGRMLRREDRRLLDVGSPKDLAAFLAGQGAEVVATDILESAVALSERYARAQGIAGRGPGRVHSEVQDARRLTYADCVFDAAFSVSVVEHIPDDGDTLAIRELVRVVRPGGQVIVTTPFDREYRETWVDRPVYERARSSNEKVFFERHYDAAALRARLLDIPGTRLSSLELWGEPTIGVERWLNRSPRVRAVASPLEAMMSRIFLKRVAYDGPCPPAAVFFVLEKLPDGDSTERSDL